MYYLLAILILAICIPIIIALWLIIGAAIAGIIARLDKCVTGGSADMSIPTAHGEFMGLCALWPLVILFYVPYLLWATLTPLRRVCWYIACKIAGLKHREVKE